MRKDKKITFWVDQDMAEKLDILTVHRAGRRPKKNPMFGPNRSGLLRLLVSIEWYEYEEKYGDPRIPRPTLEEISARLAELAEQRQAMRLEFQEIEADIQNLNAARLAVANGGA